MQLNCIHHVNILSESYSKICNYQRCKNHPNEDDNLQATPYQIMMVMQSHITHNLLSELPKVLLDLCIVTHNRIGGDRGQPQRECVSVVYFAHRSLAGLHAVHQSVRPENK